MTAVLYARQYRMTFRMEWNKR